MLLKINNMKADISLGVHEWEKRPRPMEINLTLRFDPGASVLSDNIEDALNYENIEKKILSVCATRHFNLIESLVTEIGTALLTFPQAEEVQIQVSKPGALAASESVAISGTFRR